MTEPKCETIQVKAYEQDVFSFFWFLSHLVRYFFKFKSVDETQVRDHLNEIFSSVCIASGGFSIVESEIHDHEVFRVQFCSWRDIEGEAVKSLNVIVTVILLFFFVTARHFHLLPILRVQDTMENGQKKNQMRVRWMSLTACQTKELDEKNSRHGKQWRSRRGNPN